MLLSFQPVMTSSKLPTIREQWVSGSSDQLHPTTSRFLPPLPSSPAASPAAAAATQSRSASIVSFSDEICVEKKPSTPEEKEDHAAQTPSASVDVEQPADPDEESVPEEESESEESISRYSSLTTSCPNYPPSPQRLFHVDEVFSESSSQHLLSVSSCSDYSDCWSGAVRLWPDSPPGEATEPVEAENARRQTTNSETPSAQRHSHSLSRDLQKVSSRLTLLASCRRPSEMSPSFAATLAYQHDIHLRTPSMEAGDAVGISASSSKDCLPLRRVSLAASPPPSAVSRALHVSPAPTTTPSRVTSDSGCLREQAAARFTGPLEKKKNERLRAINSRSRYFKHRNPDSPPPGLVMHRCQNLTRQLAVPDTVSYRTCSNGDDSRRRPKPVIIETDDFQISRADYNELAEQPLEAGQSVFDWSKVNEKMRMCEWWVKTRRMPLYGRSKRT